MKSNKIIKLILWFLYGATIILKCLGQNTEIIDCTNEELVTSIFNEPIDLTMPGIIKTYENVTINEILSTTNNEFELNYIDARLETNNTYGTKNLILFTTENFENYAKEQTANRISLKINLGCGMGKERVVIFFQPLKEGNYFSPLFSKATYELIIPTPIFAGFDLTAFLEITAKDDDLTHNQIAFTSNDSSQHHIRVGTKNVTSADKKTYFANLTLEKILLELPQALQFEIVATDNGDPPKSSKASVIIRSDPNRSLPPKPKFAQKLYKGLINLDFTMEPILIQLANGTYTPEVEFSLQGINIQGFNLSDNKTGLIEITWNPNNLNRSDILKHRTWEIELKAEHKNLAEVEKANVMVELADFKNFFHFVSSYYEGDIDELGELHITPIIFNPYTYQPDMQFNLQTLHDFFHMSIQNFSIQLQLNNNFTWQGIDDLGYLKLTLQASWENLSAMTHIVIKLPQIKNETPQQMFQFEKPLYVGQLNETYELDLETIVLQTDVKNTQEIEYNLSGNDSHWFYIMQNETNLQIKTILNLLPPQEVQLNKSYLLILQATHNDRETFASLVINVPQLIKQGNSKIFLTPLVKGRILINNSTQNLSMETIFVATEFWEKFNDLKFRLRGDHSLHFDVMENLTNHSIDIKLKTPLSANILESKQYLNLSLQALLTAPDGFNDTLMVFIELPIKVCPTPVTPLPDPPQFSSSNYVFTAYTNQTGILGIVNAYSNDRNVTFHYVLNVQNDLLAQRLSINPFTGEIGLYGIIEEGNYLFNITAENMETRERAVVKALLKVQPKEECKLFEGVVVEKTLMIRHVDEEKPFHGLMDLKFNENCSFHIVDMWPNDKEYVHVNYIFNMLDAIAIDREDEIFQNMTEPQVMVKLRLKCDTEIEQGNLTIDIPKPMENRATQITLTDDIPYSPDIMWLYIKIDDINDNPPEFIGLPLYLGYPSGNAALDIYPEYLTKIQVFDKDLDFNAKIKFSMRYNAYFDIEPKTGKIYPKDKVLSKDQQTELIVLATDQYGEGLMSGTVVVVKALSPDFYSLVTLKENSTKTKKELEHELSQQTGFKINVIKMSYVPQVTKQRSFTNQSISCKAWIYGYHRHQLVPYKDLQEQILVKNPEVNIVNMESYEQAALHSKTKHDNSNLGYLIVTILLSLISAASLIFIVWHFCYKPTLNTKSDTKTSSSSNGNGQQQISAECSHGFDNAVDCMECNNHNEENHHVKFSDLVENVIVEESQSK
ncbi:uncharacterized protein LOC135955355 [Calliphora vicina]|uniref:uncharacterized protein LOC135955355 n=1 Tax=Calliphora vicina TaxID=7373 RepID=UPI00325AC909